MYQLGVAAKSLPGSSYTPGSTYLPFVWVSLSSTLTIAFVSSYIMSVFFFGLVDFSSLGAADGCVLSVSVICQALRSWGLGHETALLTVVGVPGSIVCLLSAPHREAVLALWHHRSQAPG